MEFDALWTEQVERRCETVHCAPFPRMNITREKMLTLMHLCVKKIPRRLENCTTAAGSFWRAAAPDRGGAPRQAHVRCLRIVDTTFRGDRRRDFKAPDR
jgi:hypothetical protein